MTQGAVYIAVGPRVHLEAALISAVVFTGLNPGIPATIFCDRGEALLSTLNEELLKVGIRIRAVEGPAVRSGRFMPQSLKTRLGVLSPYSETLYLDADVLPLKPVPRIWDHLDLEDVAMVLDCHPTVDQCDHISQIEIDYTLSKLSGSTRQFNTGVMLWRTNASTRALFERWQAEWSLFGKHDQLALVRAAEGLGISIQEMPLRFNTPPPQNGETPCLVGVDLLHCWGGWVKSGAFTGLARQQYPETVQAVKSLLSSVP